MNHWLFKTEPDLFSIEHLKQRKYEIWDGVRNYQARNFLRDNTQIGDQVLFYHSSAKIIGIAGIAIISKTHVVDPSQFDKNSDYYDPKSTKENPRWITVEVKYKSKFKNIITKEELGNHPALKEMMVLKKGSRLSIQPVSKIEFEYIVKNWS